MFLIMIQGSLRLKSFMMEKIVYVIVEMVNQLIYQMGV